MKNPPFVIDYKIQLNDISIDAKLRSWVIFNYLQDAAGCHADELGVGLKQLRQSDLSWVLSRIRVRMDEFPEYGDILRIATYPSGFDRLFAYRQFVLTSAITGKKFGVAGSAWLTLNPENFRPISPAKHFAGLSSWEFEGDIWFQEDTLGKLVPPADGVAPVTQRISRTQIDYNRHLNNAYYAMFAEDWLAEKLGQPVRFTELQINFNQSTAYGDKLICSGTLDENGSFQIAGTQDSSGKNAFTAYGNCVLINN